MVQVVTVQPRTLPVEFEELGRTAASRRVEIRSRIRGFILARHFQDGQRVREGDLLFEIDPREFIVALDQAKASLVRATANFDLAQREVERLTPLVRQQSISKKELDDAEARLKAAAGDVAFARAEVARQELNLSYTKITSPVTGVIGVARRDVGAFVDEGANSLLTDCLQLDPIDINFSIPERALLRYRRLVEEGRLLLPPSLSDWEVVIELLDGSVYRRTGRLTVIGFEVAPTTGTALFRAQVDNPFTPGDPGGSLIEGQFVKVRLRGARQPDALAVPMRAVLQGDQGPFVWVVGPDDVPQMRPVVTGKWAPPEWIIERGLQPGDRVIVDGVQQLLLRPPGTKVVVSPEPAPPARSLSDARPGPAATGHHRSDSSPAPGAAGAATTRPTATPASVP